MKRKFVPTFSHFDEWGNISGISSTLSPNSFLLGGKEDRGRSACLSALAGGLFPGKQSEKIPGRGLWGSRKCLKIVWYGQGWDLINRGSSPRVVSSKEI